MSRVAQDRDTQCAMRSCRRPPTVWVGMLEGRLCEYHADLIWWQVEGRDAGKSDEEVPGREGREYERAQCRAKRAEGRKKPSAVGQIYFVRVEQLIKVGWTTKLADRIRAYGPNAELLANYPGRRADEAALHRQLAPARYRGREWYSDCDIIRAFISEAIEKHGPPRFKRIPWTEPKASNIKPKSWR